ncbi:hypothetical protein SynMVIR181_01737 [Synechococcus sp. MVIR-18-1]|nr:hypothetical protein SynMVIR181_01737 [Synechococcus sp. MVIR-18-1]
MMPLASLALIAISSSLRRFSVLQVLRGTWQQGGFLKHSPASSDVDKALLVQLY